MADYLKDLNRLQLHWVGKEHLLDKDAQKNKEVGKFHDSVIKLYSIPILASVYQISLMGNPALV